MDRISTLVNELLEFARPSDPKVEAENINSILDSILLLMGQGTKKKHIHMVKHFSPNLPPIPIDREQIKQVFLNLLINAIEATEENGQITSKQGPTSNQTATLTSRSSLPIRDVGFQQSILRVSFILSSPQSTQEVGWGYPFPIRSSRNIKDILTWKAN